jgi:hypothetical protein
MSVPWIVLAQAELSSQRFVGWVFVYYVIAAACILALVLAVIGGGRLFGYGEEVPDRSPRRHRFAGRWRHRHA